VFSGSAVKMPMNRCILAVRTVAHMKLPSMAQRGFNFTGFLQRPTHIYVKLSKTRSSLI